MKIVVIEVSYVNFPKIYCYKGSFLNGKVQFKPSQNGIGFFRGNQKEKKTHFIYITSFCSVPSHFREIRHILRNSELNPIDRHLLFLVKSSFSTTLLKKLNSKVQLKIPCRAKELNQASKLSSIKVIHSVFLNMHNSKVAS